MREPSNLVSRRRFMAALLAGSASLGPLAATSAFAQATSEEEIPHLLKKPEADFVFARVWYRGGDWNTDMLYQGLKGGSDINLLQRVLQETTIRTEACETVLKLSSPLVFTCPFLYMTGHGRILLGETEIENLRLALEGGAFLFGDACNGKGKGFDENIRSVLRRVFPSRPLRPLPMNHPLYSCFFKIDRIQGGDKLIDPYMEGIEIDGRLAVVHTVNDLGCAWEGHRCRPGGEEQRTHAFRLGINMIVYALTH